MLTPQLPDWIKTNCIRAAYSNSADEKLDALLSALEWWRGIRMKPYYPAQYGKGELSDLADTMGFIYYGA